MGKIRRCPDPTDLQSKLEWCEGLLALALMLIFYLAFRPGGILSKIPANYRELLQQNALPRGHKRRDPEGLCLHGEKKSEEVALGNKAKKPLRTSRLQVTNS